MGAIRKILCVDDEKNVLRSLKRAFIDEEYELFIAESGEEGLRILEEEKDILIVISDYRMPGMDGVEFLGRVFQKWPETVRIVLSGYADTASVVAAINEGRIYKFIPKPWDDEDLLSIIQESFERYALQKKNFQLVNQLQRSNDELKKENEVLEKITREKIDSLRVNNVAFKNTQRILDAIPFALLGVDENNMIVYGNENVLSVFPDQNTVPLGSDLADLFPEKMVDEINTSILHKKFFCMKMEDRVDPMRVHISPLDDTDGNGFLIIIDPLVG